MTHTVAARAQLKFDRGSQRSHRCTRGILHTLAIDLYAATTVALSSHFQPEWRKLFFLPSVKALISSDSFG